MPVRVHGLGVLSDFVPLQAPRGGLLLGTDGRWVALGPEGLLHMRVVDSVPRWDRCDRMTYAVVDASLYALDARSGDVVWERDVASADTLLAAHAGGVDVCAAGSLWRYARQGGLRAFVPDVGPATCMHAEPHRVWIGGPLGVRCVEGDRTADLAAVRAARVRDVSAGVCRALYPAVSGAWAVMEAPAPSLVHDDGAPLQWPLPAMDGAEVAGRADDTFWMYRSGAVPRVVDRRQQVRWSWSRTARLVAADGPFALVADERAVLAGPAGPDLVLPVDAPSAVWAGDGLYAVVSGGDTHLFMVEDAR